MEKPSYPFKSTENHRYYYFQSIGKSVIPKIVVYQPLEGSDNVVELAFGNLMPNFSIDVFAIDDNDDMSIVITTVIYTIFDYLNYYPEKKVYFKGSTPSRTRLYRVAIAKMIDKIEPIYQVYGLISDSEMEIFNKNQTYIAYLISRKNEKIK